MRDRVIKTAPTHSLPRTQERKYHNSNGFTLIELSIVLVIIGLIVGGILTGQSLIEAAGVRAQISQIEKYNTAANTFRGKYGYLPGDIKDPDASNFGFAARGQYAGEGDGNGIICGVTSNAANSLGQAGTDGETAMFWEDLSTAHLIDGGFTAASTTTGYFTSALSSYIPGAKIGNGNYIYVWCTQAVQNNWTPTSPNWFGLSEANSLGPGVISSFTSLTARQAYQIDSKIDDGLPQSGNVIAMYIDINFGQNVWAGGGYPNQGASGGYPLFAPTTNYTAPSATSCYDNRGSTGQVQQYSLTYNNGNGANCALSFKMQAGD